MTTASDIRDPALMREELEDLTQYLNGLPEEVRRTGAFSAYEQRVGELSQELILTEMSLKLHLPFTLLKQPRQSEYGQIYECLSTMTRRSESVAQRSLTASVAFRWFFFAASAATVVSALAAASSLVLPFSGIAASLAGVYAGWIAERARKQEHKAMRLDALREEVTHLFGPAGQVLMPSEYYSASAKRIESLLNEVESAAPGNLPARQSPRRS